MPAPPAIGANVYKATWLEGAPVSLLVIEKSAYLYLRTVVRLEIASLAHRLQWSQCQGWARGRWYNTYGPLPCSLWTGVRCVTLPQTDMAEHAPLGPACKAEVE